MPSCSYPPEISEEAVDHLVDQARDWQISHGLLLKYRQDEVIRSIPIGVTLFPSLFPRVLFEQAQALQKLYNELYMRIAGDEEWLYETLQSVIKGDAFASTLWGIHELVQEEGYVQDLSLGIFRSDYMLHKGSSTEQSLQPLQLKQVEFNTFSVAGASHSCNVSQMHQYLNNTGIYRQPVSASELPISSLQTNSNITSLASALAAAHCDYGSPHSIPTSTTAILFVVQPNNINICDERPIEYALSTHHKIQVHRLELISLADDSSPILTHTKLGPKRELLFHHPTIPNLIHEISVVYLRAGYDVAEYNDGLDGPGAHARYHLERSLAIKCPSILSHLTTFKAVQAALCLPTTIDRFLPAATNDEKRLLASTFMPMSTLSSTQLDFRDPTIAQKYVLKPSSAEGGGHNIFREDICTALKDGTISDRDRGNFIVMEMIQSPEDQREVLITPMGEVYMGETVSELGIFGTCIWRHRIKKGRRLRPGNENGNGDVGDVEAEKEAEPGAKQKKSKSRRLPRLSGLWRKSPKRSIIEPSPQPSQIDTERLADMTLKEQPEEEEDFFEILQNNGAVGWSLKTKPRGVDEMSVVKGYGCFDSPILV